MATPQRVAAVRQFSRFYTRRIGVLKERFLASDLTLAEGRVVYELARREGATATELTAELDLDAGYLSRLLRKLEDRGLVGRQPSPTDGRQSIVRLTERGYERFAAIDARSREEVAQMLGALSEADQRRLIDALGTVESLLSPAAERRAPYLLRPHQPGDLGWIVHRHGALYAREYGWDERFEALVATVVAQFVERFDPRRERCWMAERDGEVVGSVMLVAHSEPVAQLRLLLVEPGARGLGIGARLVDECMRFARQAGYRRMTLWTNSVLVAARRIYEKAGFRLVRSEPHHSFGHDLVGETWERDL
jgi:DNA-binding MarR family transcriptional regulator/N-acetylglutamate synthase-like GNAT family acetyltransferase